MLAGISTVFVVAGGTLAQFARRFPVRTETLETIAGFMLIGGFALIGSALPVLL